MMMIISTILLAFAVTRTVVNGSRRIVLQQPHIPPPSRQVLYRTDDGYTRRQLHPLQHDIGWNHIHIDASREHPDIVFADLSQTSRPRIKNTAWSLGSILRRTLLSDNTNEEAFTGQTIEYDDLESETNLTRTADGSVSSETEFNITENRHNDTMSTISTNNTAKAVEFRPLRIKAFVSDEAGNAQFLNATEYDILLNRILRPGLLAWSAALRVPPVARNLTVDATQLADGRLCGPGPSVPVPPSHTTYGVPDVDMLLYVHLSFHDRNATHQCEGDYLAASSFCSTDQLDRPVAALLHLCVTEGFFAEENAQMNIQSVMHEMGHALGFNAISLAHFRRPDGTPWTPRNASGAVPLQTVECTGPFNVTSTIPLPSSDILQFRTVRGGVRVAQVVTPSVRQVVRNHFDCQELPGAELESGEYLPESVAAMTASCIGDHWERRLFQTDLMNPIIDEKVSFNPRFSTLTLAYFADSGWYQVDLSRASMASNWGRAAGCDFVEENCIRNGQVPTQYEAFFCTQEDDTDALEMRGCTIDLERKAFCSMGTFDGELPPAYQYFNGSNLGGKDAFMDYCPVYSGFANGQCTDRSNADLLRASRIERFGRRNSRCLAGQVTTGNPSFITPQRKADGTGFEHPVTFSLKSEQRAFCLPIACVVEDRSLRVQVDGHWEICREKDEVIVPRESTDVLSVVCPDPVRVCPTFYCTRDCLGTNKYCNYTVGKCMCESWQTSTSEDGPCVNATAKAPFYKPPQEDKDSGLPSPDDPLSDIYVAKARNLTDESRWFWSARNTSIIAASVFVVAVLFSLHLSKKNIVICQRQPPSPPDAPGAVGDDQIQNRDKLKLMASVVVDLRMNNNGSMQRRMDMLQNRDSETDVASETSFISNSGTIADLSEQLDIPRSNEVVEDPLAPPPPVRRRFLSRL